MPDNSILGKIGWNAVKADPSPSPSPDYGMDAIKRRMQNSPDDSESYADKAKKSIMKGFGYDQDTKAKPANQNDGN